MFDFISQKTNKGGLSNLPIGRQVEMPNMKIGTKSYIEKLLPELKPNREPMLMGIAFATILQNLLLPAGLSIKP
jgi:hypothetical protein